MSKSTFDHYVPVADQVIRIETVREAFRRLESALLSTCPAGRHRAVAMTNLETACMWAVKAIIFEEAVPDA